MRKNRALNKERAGKTDGGARKRPLPKGGGRVARIAGREGRRANPRLSTGFDSVAGFDFLSVLVDGLGGVAMPVDLALGDLSEGDHGRFVA